MKKYPHIISKLYYEPLLITRARHHALCQVVEAHMAKVESGESGQGDPKPEYSEVEDTAIIPVHGVIVGHASDIPMSSCGCGLDDVSDMIDVAESDSNIKRLVFDFRSPGGGVTFIPEIGRKIAGIVSKQTVAFTDSECCSGALWLATQCQRFYATESSSIGSIGVWTAYLDLSRQMQLAGENMQAVSAGKYKLTGAYWKPLTPEELKMLQAEVDDLHQQFKDAVNIKRQIGNEYMEGQIFDGQEAAEIGLIDGNVEGLGEVLDMPIG